ncbi:MAG TPA: isoprenylcysteine carboxylmethyltransferase family protein [Blastocatellia bacterium]|jgi:protein-S-isoprenylcysteine O-methyltransferase Ste14
MTEQTISKPNRALMNAASLLIFMLAYLALGVVCLWQWGEPRGWSRIDFFTGLALVISVLMGAEHLSFNRSIADEAKSEAFGTSYDPGMAGWVTMLGIAELVVFLDYGHWHLAPALESKVLQSAGLGLYIITLLWLRWVDSTLATHFSDARAAREVITEGPFRHIRHPRYAALIASRIAFALTFASLLGWILAAGWMVVVRRRIRLEEAHLEEMFGPEYEAYASKTARLIPGVY